jgi:hypothetical protein
MKNRRDHRVERLSFRSLHYELQSWPETAELLRQVFLLPFDYSGREMPSFAFRFALKLSKLQNLRTAGPGIAMNALS